MGLYRYGRCEVCSAEMPVLYMKKKIPDKLIWPSHTHVVLPYGIELSSTPISPLKNTALHKNAVAAVRYRLRKRAFEYLCRTMLAHIVSKQERFNGVPRCRYVTHMLDTVSRTHVSPLSMRPRLLRPLRSSGGWTTSIVGTPSASGTTGTSYT